MCPYPPQGAGGITKLSQLEIDANKDWASFGIDSLGHVIIEDGAGHYFKLPSLTTAQRDALTPATGMTIWNSDNTQVEKYNGASWGALGIAGVSVRKDFGDVIGTRPQLNIMTGVGVELMVEDNPPDDEIDIMYSSTTLHKHFVMLPEDAILPVANPPAKASTDGANFSYETLDYDDGTEETAYWERWLTPDYDLENVVADIDWIAAAGAGDVKFGLQVLGRAEGEAWDVALGAEGSLK